MPYPLSPVARRLVAHARKRGGVHHVAWYQPLARRDDGKLFISGHAISRTDSRALRELVEGGYATVVCTSHVDGWWGPGQRRRAHLTQFELTPAAATVETGAFYERGRLRHTMRPSEDDPAAYPGLPADVKAPPPPDPGTPEYERLMEYEPRAA